ncbi:MAG: hypothetical protein K0Q95_2905 [Bacteroidota bacterium]|jgi:hypothetical protein|nr:hypothetical protein [Bacteroidota bacterium]
MMKMLTNKISATLFVMLMVSAQAFSQGWVSSPLVTNSTLVKKSMELQDRGISLRSRSIMDTLILDSSGFFDDFSYEGPYPDSNKWINNYVFVNRTLGIAPPTLGVATFDGVDEGGYPYDFTAGMYTSGRADTLTSKPIDLYYPGDTSVYFSFYYQAQGRGNFPDPLDSLILEFKAPVTGAWHHVWAKRGLSAATADSTWDLIMIHITDAEFLQKGFQFRFTNWATLSGNGDHWNIDYVYLKKGRGYTDTLFTDLAIVYDTPSLLKDYYAVPWQQYDTSMMKSRYDITIRNNNNVNSFGSFNYRIFDQNGVQVDTTYSGGNFNYSPFATSGYSTYPNFAKPLINYKIPALTGKSEYTFESYIGGFPNSRGINDTVRHKQIFDNYYAYDDGSAEISFGLAGFLHAQIAEKFTLRVSDTLRCIDIYFNPQWTDASQYTFKLKVWANSGGAPGSLIYANPTLDIPEYAHGGHDQFTRYYLDAPVYLNGGTTFFIGFDQNTSQPINIGVDVNTDSQDNLYYNTNGSWQHPPVSGSLMMHPVLGTAAAAVGINENLVNNQTFTLYPNPSNDRLFIGSDKAYSAVSYTVTDLVGKTVLINSVPLNEAIDVSSLSNGVYFMRLNNGNTISTQKFIISR